MANLSLNKIEIKKKYEELLDGKTYSEQQRGFEFEKLIFSVLQNEELEPRASYKPEGEQVDGSFFWQGQTFLLEAKWVKKPLPASSIYAFKGKLDGKFHTTSGIFISVNGYNNDVEDALKFGKSLNIILFDTTDIPLIFNGVVPFTEILKFKLRQAGDTGSLQVPYELKEKAEKISNPESIEILNPRTTSELQLKKPIQIDDLLVFVEGKSDIMVIDNLIQPLIKNYNFSYKIVALNGANNIRQLPSLLNIYGDYHETKAVIIILDNDQLTNEMGLVIRNIEKQFQNSSIYVRPIFLFINDTLKSRLKEKLSIEELRKEPLFDRLELFIDQMAEDYYDPEKDIPILAIKSELERLELNFEESTIEGIDEEHGMPYTINSLEELISHLEEVIVQTLIGEMPTEWLKEQDDFYYESEVREYLLDHYSEQIKKLGWNLNEL